IGSPSMNLFEGTLTGDELTAGTFAIQLRDAAFERRPGLRSYAGRKIVFGIRPEHLYDSSLESGRKYQTIPAKVTSIEELGSEHIVHLNIDAVRVDSGDPDAVRDFGLASNAVAKFEPESAVRSGSEIRLALD
ncbi:MAG: TOBE domain-containing protein, partial [Mesorhizobium sp.]